MSEPGDGPSDKTPAQWAALFTDECQRNLAEKPGYEATRRQLLAVADRAPEFGMPLDEATAEVEKFLDLHFDRPASRFDGLGQPRSVLDIINAGRAPGIVVVGADEFAAMEFPPREFVLEPVLHQKTLAMIHAWRGTGKTLVAMGCALAVSTGGQFLTWKAPKARRVLYIDGELPQETLQDRVRDVSESSGLAVTSNLRLLTPDLQPEGIRVPNLSDPAGQETVLDLAKREQAEFVILDNLSTLFRSGEENTADDWQVAQDFLVLLRSRGHTVLFLHHDGKEGTQRGTSKREDVLDVIISLSRPSDYRIDQGARLEVHFEKNRTFHGAEAVLPFEAWLNGGVWTVQNLTAALDQRIAEGIRSGLNNTEIAEQIGVSRSTVSRRRKVLGSGDES